MAVEQRLADLQKAVENVLTGNYPNPRHHRPGQCKHDTWYWEQCESCNDEYLEAALAASKQ